MNFNFRKGKSGVSKALQNVMKRVRKITMIDIRSILILMRMENFLKLLYVIVDFN